MRKTFISTLVDLAKEDERIILLTGDLGYTALEVFAERFPDRFINVGIAEQNMVGMATGLADAGLIPFVYSIANFAVLRPFEFIRNGPIVHRAMVRIVGVGGGFEYGANGISHHAVEDIGVMRTQAGMVTVVPADHQQAATALSTTWNYDGPVYYRLGKDDSTLIPGLNGAFLLGSAQTIASGKDVLIVSTGSVSDEAVMARETLVAEGMSVGHLVVSCFNPSPVDDLANEIIKSKAVVTVEAHSINGGLGSFVAEVIAETGSSCRLLRCGVRDVYDGRSGSKAYMRRVHGIDAAAIAAAAKQVLGV